MSEYIKRQDAIDVLGQVYRYESDRMTALQELPTINLPDEELDVTQSDIDAFKAYIEDCMDDVAFGNTDWNHSYALALKCMEAHLKNSFEI